MIDRIRGIVSIEAWGRTVAVGLYAVTIGFLILGLLHAVRAIGGRSSFDDVAVAGAVAGCSVVSGTVVHLLAELVGRSQ